MSDRLPPAIKAGGRAASVGQMTAPRSDWERELVAALVDIACRPGRHTPSVPPVPASGRTAPTQPAVLNGKEVNGRGSNRASDDDARVGARAIVDESTTSDPSDQPDHVGEDPCQFYPQVPASVTAPPRRGCATSRSGH